MVSSVLHRRAAQGLSELLTARAVVGRAARGGWTLQLELRSSQGQQTRVLQADECRLLARAAAVVVAVQLDPLARGRTLQAAATREPGEAPASVDAPLPGPVAPANTGDGPEVPLPPAPVFPDPVAPRPVVRRIDPVVELEALPEPPRVQVEAGPRLAGHLRLEGGLEVGLLPGSGGLVGLVGGVVIRGVRLEAGLAGSPLRSAPSPGGDARARLDRFAGALRVCPGWTSPRARLTISGCLGGEAGVLRASGVGVANPSTVHAPWVALSLGPALRLRLAGPLGLRLGVEGVVALARPTFTVGTEPLFRVTPAGLRVNLGLDLQFVARKR